MTWRVHVNGLHYDRWERFNFSRDLENNVGKFSVTTTDTFPKDYPIQGNDVIEIYWDDQICMTGYADEICIGGGMDGRTINCSGRDILCDAVDSSVPDKAKNTKGTFGLQAVCESVLKSLGMTTKVIDTTKDKIGKTKVKQQKTSDCGDKAMAFLAKLAAKNQVYLVADERGDLLIYRAGDIESDLELNYRANGDRNNVLSATLDIKLQELFSKIKVRGQGQVAYDATPSQAKDLADVNGSHYDSNARPTRYLEIKVSEPISRKDAEKRAIDEVNLRRARAFSYKCKINYFTTQSGKIFRLGDKVSVEDDERQVSGKFIIKAFSVDFDMDGGTKVDLDLAPEEAYQIVEIDERKDKIHAGRKRKQFVKKYKNRFKE